MTPDKQLVLEAVNDLIADPDPRPKVEAMDAVYQLSNRHPVRLAGHLSVLNPLLTIRRADEQAWEGIKRLIDEKRALRGLRPCWSEPEPEAFLDRKPAYQRDLMRERRYRMGRASNIENMQRPAHEQLRGDARMDFERMAHNKWAARRDEFLAKAVEAQGSPLTRARAAELRDEFWRMIDAELDEKERLVRQELTKPLSQRHIVP